MDADRQESRHEAIYASNGSFTLRPGTTTLKPWQCTDKLEEAQCQHHKISALQGLRFKAKLNAKVLACCYKYMAYPLKCGNIRVISFSGEEMIKLGTTAKAAIVDMAFLGGSPRSQHCKLVAIDSKGFITIFDLAEGCAREVLEIKIAAAAVEMFLEGPCRVVAHDQEQQFLTMHGKVLRLWSEPMLWERSESLSATLRRTWVSADDLQEEAQELYALAVVPEGLCELAAAEGLPLFRDMCFSADGQLVLALLTNAVVLVWSRERNEGDGGGILELRQEVTLGSEAGLGAGLKDVQSLHVLSDVPTPSFSESDYPLCPKSRGHNEVLVLSAASGSFVCYALDTHAARVGKKLQTVQLSSGAASTKAGVLATTDQLGQRVLVVTLPGPPSCALLFPVAMDWAASEEPLPFPRAQQLLLPSRPEALFFQAVRSSQTKGSAILMLTATNFKRADGLPCSSVDLYQILDESLVCP